MSLDVHDRAKLCGAKQDRRHDNQERNVEGLERCVHFARPLVATHRGTSSWHAIVKTAPLSCRNLEQPSLEEFGRSGL